MFKRTLLIGALVISLAMLWSNTGWAGFKKPGAGWGTTWVEHKVQMAGEGACDFANPPYGDCMLEVVALIPTFSAESVPDEDNVCKTFAPMIEATEDPATWPWVEADCILPVAIFEDNPNTNRRNPAILTLDPNSFKWSTSEFAQISELDFNCSKNGACWVLQTWYFEELLGEKRKHWVKNGIAVTGLAFNITYDRGFVCGEVDLSSGDVVLEGYPAPNNIQCCEFEDFDTEDGSCAEGNPELFNRVSCVDDVRTGDLAKPQCTPQIGSYQLQGAPTNKDPGNPDYKGLPHVFLQRFELEDDFQYVFGTEGFYPSADCPGPEDGYDGLNPPRRWDCDLPM
jgi:hypothetical protein